MKKNIKNRKLIIFLIVLFSSLIIFILIILKRTTSQDLERSTSQDNVGVNKIFHQEYESYLKTYEEDYEELLYSSSSMGQRGFRHMHNISKLGPMVLPYIMEKVTQTKDMNFTLPLSLITGKRFSKSEWPEGTYGDSRTLIILYIDWWEKGRNLTPLQFNERYARLMELRDADKKDEVSECRDEIRKLGIAALPMIIEKVKEGDKELIPIVSRLTDGQVEENASIPQCVEWWRDNKQKWLIPFPNKRPVAKAGPNQTVTAGNPVQLDGSASSDEDKDELTYTWTQTKGPPVKLSDETSAKPTFTAPEVKVSTALIFELKVNDAGDIFKSCPTPNSESKPDTIQITVNPK